MVSLEKELEHYYFLKHIISLNTFTKSLNECLNNFKDSREIRLIKSPEDPRKYDCYISLTNRIPSYKSFNFQRECNIGLIGRYIGTLINDIPRPFDIRIIKDLEQNGASVYSIYTKEKRDLLY